MKNYYDMSKVDFVVDYGVTEKINSFQLDGGYRSVNYTPVNKIKVQINGGGFTLEGKEADRFIEQFEEYQQNKEEGLVK